MATVSLQRPTIHPIYSSVLLLQYNESYREECHNTVLPSWKCGFQYNHRLHANILKVIRISHELWVGVIFAEWFTFWRDCSALGEFDSLRLLLSSLCTCMAPIGRLGLPDVNLATCIDFTSGTEHSILVDYCLKLPEPREGVYSVVQYSECKTEKLLLSLQSKTGGGFHPQFICLCFLLATQSNILYIFRWNLVHVMGGIQKWAERLWVVLQIQ